MAITIDMQQLENRYAAANPQPAAAPAPEQPTYAQRILRDIPAKMAAAKAKLLAGDTTGGKADLDYVSTWVDENQGALEEFTNYTGTNRTAKLISEKALGLISRDEIMQMSPLANPAANERSVDFEAARNGWGPEMTGLAKKARYEKDPYALAMLAQFGRQPAQAPRRTGQAPAQEPDPISQFESLAKYAKTFTARVSPVVSLGADEMAGLAKIGFDAGDMESGTRITEIAVAAARESGLDDVGRANVFKSALRASSDAMKAWGATDELQKAQGAEVLAALAHDTGAVKDMPGRKQQIAQVMGQTSQMIAQYRDMDSEIGSKLGAKSAIVARALYRRQFSGAAPDAPEDAPVMSAMSRMSQLSGRLVNNRLLSGDPAMQAAAGGKPAETVSDGFGLFEDVIRQHITASGGAAIANDSEVDRELENRSEDLARGLMDLGVPSIDEARAAASVVTQALLKGETLDVRRIPELIAAAEVNREVIGKGIEASVTAGTTEKELPDLERSLFSQTLEREYAKLPATNPDGTEIPEAERRAQAQTNANNSADVALYDAFMKMDIGNRDLIGVGDRNVTVRGFQKAVAPIVPRLFFEQSPMFKMLFEETKFADLDKRGTRELAIQAVEDAYAANAQLAWRGSKPKDERSGDALRKLIAAQVDRVIGNIKEAAARTGVDPSLTPAQSIGSDPETVMAIGRGRRATAIMTPYGGTPEATTMLDAADEAQGLAEVFVKGLGVPEGQRGAGVKARAKLLSLASMPAPARPATAVTPAAPAPSIELNLTKTPLAVATKGYNALLRLNERLNKPIQDRITAKFVERDLPEMLAESKISPFRAGPIKAAARKLAVAGTPLETIERATWKALADLDAANKTEAFNAYQAKKRFDAALKKEQEGIGALGGADEGEEDGR